MNYRMLLLHAGPVPPANGPVRESFLLSNGTQSLQDAAECYEAVVSGLHLDGLLPVERFLTEPTPDAGAIEDLRDEWVRIRNSLDDEDIAIQRGAADRAVKQAMRALNHLEDTGLAEEAHIWVHRTARLRTGLYGCRIRVEGDTVWSDCAVRISHERWGASVEMTTVWNCSICGDRFDSCQHDPDATYDVSITRLTNGECSACLEVSCNHEDGEIIRTTPFPVAASISAGAVAVVERPRYPDARPTCVSLPITPESELFSSALAGELNCDLCLKPCPGWSYMHHN